METKNTNTRLRVNPKNYALFSYTPYLDRNCKPIPRPDKVTYDLGDVVYIKSENSIGVVLGNIDEQSQEVRTDMDGMQCFDNLEPATLAHFEIKGVHFMEELKGEVFGTWKRKLNDEQLETIVDKYVELGGEVRRGYLFRLKENQATIQDKVVYAVDDNGKKQDRLGDFTTIKTAKEFVKEIGVKLVK